MTVVYKYNVLQDEWKVGECLGRMAVICMIFHRKEGGIMPV